MTGPHQPDATIPRAADTLRCDLFERALLPVARHFLAALQHPGHTGWHSGYALAAETWNESPGLSVAHHLQRLLRAVWTCRGGRFAYHPPETDQKVTEDERLLIAMLHHMRRDRPREARNCAEVLTAGTLDPEVVRAGLRFATRFSVGAQTRPHRPNLSVVQ